MTTNHFNPAYNLEEATAEWIDEYAEPLIDALAWLKEKLTVQELGENLEELSGIVQDAEDSLKELRLMQVVKGAQNAA